MNNKRPLSPPPLDPWHQLHKALTEITKQLKHPIDTIAIVIIDHYTGRYSVMIFDAVILFLVLLFFHVSL